MVDAGAHCPSPHSGLKQPIPPLLAVLVADGSQQSRSSPIPGNLIQTLVHWGAVTKAWPPCRNLRRLWKSIPAPHGISWSLVMSQFSIPLCLILLPRASRVKHGSSTLLQTSEPQSLLPWEPPLNSWTFSQGKGSEVIYSRSHRWQNQELGPDFSPAIHGSSHALLQEWRVDLSGWRLAESRDAGKHPLSHTSIPEHVVMFSKGFVSFHLSLKNVCIIAQVIHECIVLIKKVKTL